MRITEDHKNIRRTAHEFAEKYVNPYIDEWEKAGHFPAHELFKQAGNLGLLGITKPEAYGDLKQTLRDGGARILNCLTPHGKWHIHSTYMENHRMLTLSRGCEPVWMSEVDAEELGIQGDYGFEAVGPSKRLRETVDAVTFAFGMALVAIYMILAAQFNSFVHPFTIMLSAPLSFIGAFAAVAVMGYQLDTLGQISFLMLMGIVMKNGILLVDYTNTLRSRGRSPREAVLEAGPVRLRPVLMTAVSTICGMMPLAYGTGDGSEWRSPMGVICIGGLAASTLLTLLVVPVAYTLIDDLQGVVVRLSRWTLATGLRAAGRNDA